MIIIVMLVEMLVFTFVLIMPFTSICQKFVHLINNFMRLHNNYDLPAWLYLQPD